MTIRPVVMVCRMVMRWAFFGLGTSSSAESRRFLAFTVLVFAVSAPECRRGDVSVLTRPPLFPRFTRTPAACTAEALLSNKETVQSACYSQWPSRASSSFPLVSVLT